MINNMINRFHFSLISILFVLASSANAETEQVRNSLVQFMTRLSSGNSIPREANWGWNLSSDPCNDNWKGVECYTNTATVRKIILDRLNLTGSIDAASLCTAPGLRVLSLNSNGILGTLSEDILKCARLTHMYLHENRLSGSLPVSLSRLYNLKRIDVSNNGFSGRIPDMSRVSNLFTFLAENNHLSEEIPNFNFSNLENFDVSNNNLQGRIPNSGGHFGAASFTGNPGLCGPPLPNPCPPKKSSSSKDYFIYSGYALIGLIVVLLISFKLTKNKFRTDNNHNKTTESSSSESKAVGENRSEFSLTSESGKNSSSMMVLASPMVGVLKFEDLLRSPAELIGRGRRGSLYKVTVEGGGTLAVKRIRDWEIGRDEFKQRMRRIDEVKHKNVMPIVAFYCSRQEKLLVYEFQENGSLFDLLHGSQKFQTFNWRSRLNVAAKTADALACMHHRLKADKIPHGNLKSSNILLTPHLSPLITEYGLTESDDAFAADAFSFGVVLLELLTGKVVKNNGVELARWVSSAVREEWTAEVFDKALVAEGADEGRMVRLLQVAMNCINARPEMAEVARLIEGLMEEEDERSVCFHSS